MEFRGLSKRACVVHAIHVPRIVRWDGRHTVHAHHIHPLGNGGPDVPSNVVYVCPTGHDAIHELLREWLRVGGKPSWDTRRFYHPKERYYAELGYKRIKGLT